MTTQPETAVGSEATPAAEANPAAAFNDIAAEMLGEDEPEEQEAEDAPLEDDEPDEPSEDDIEQDDDLPAIEAPNSLTAEEKEKFKSLPREAQEFTARRIGEMEKGFSAKAQEAAQAKEAARTEAYQFMAQAKAEMVENLSQYAKMFEVRPPDAALFRSNPDAYAQQLETYQYATAQREQAQREAETAKVEQAQYQAALQQHEAQAFRQRLESELPEAFQEGGQTNKTFIDGLAATAEALGYDDNAIQQASVEELKALKQVGEWKADAEKYRKAVSKKMERVRAGKNPPPIARPGVSRTADASRKGRADQAWETVKTAKSRGTKDDAMATWMENSGWL